MSKRPNKLRVMADGLEPRRSGWAVATGDVGQPSRSCHWRVVGFFSSKPTADVKFKTMPDNAGRALLDLTNAAIVWIGRDGKIIEPRG